MTDSIIEEFNSFKYQYEEIRLASNEYDFEDDCLLVINAEHCMDEPGVNIHYYFNHCGSDRFNQWLNKWSLEEEWIDSCRVGIYKVNNKKN